jgi:cytochrome c oxidase assembly protein subunit 20
MADDTRQTTKEDLSREALTVDPTNKAFSGSQWSDESKPQTFKPPENANLMAGGTQHTAGGQVPEVNIWNALNVGAPLTEIHKRPCVRTALMTGIGVGVALGGVRFIFRGEKMRNHLCDEIGDTDALFSTGVQSL